MNKLTLFLAMIAIGIASAKAQCDMSILYENKLQEVVHARLHMTLPDGKNVLLLDDTAEYKNTSFHLEQKGEYRIMAFFSGNESGKDSLEKSFILTGDEYSIETNLQFELKQDDFPFSQNKEPLVKCRFTFKLFSKPSPDVHIRFKYYSRGDSTEIPGPFFEVINNSDDTLYGEWLPGFFWGTVSFWDGSAYFGNLGGRIDLNCEGLSPLLPNDTTHAWVGSFGRSLRPGKYRFNVYYSTEDKRMHSVAFERENMKIRWYTNVSKWHLLTNEFEIK